MEKREQLYEGKAKKVYATDDAGCCIVSYKDDATAFDGQKKGTIAGKGAVNNRMSNYLMQLLEKAGVPTHFVQELNDRETVVKKVSIVPLEVIVRNISAGSFAKRYGVVIEVLSSYVRKPGTKVKEVAKKMEEMKISGIAKDNDVARIAVVGVPDEPGIAFRVFNTMARAKINVDIILQSYGKKGTNDISFTVPLPDADAAAEALSELQESIGYDHLSVDTNVCKVSIVGAGMMSASGIAALMFEALYDAKINIQMISTSEIKVSVLIEKGYADQAVQAIHNKFFG